MCITWNGLSHPNHCQNSKIMCFFVLYRHFRFQNGISQLLTINESKVMLETYFSISGSNPLLVRIAKSLPVQIP